MQQKHDSNSFNVSLELESKKNKVGRPCGESNNRDALIAAARELFVEHDYARVSIREIANRAGTDSGLIRYYFGSKKELLTAMMRETAKPVLAQLTKSHSEAKKENPVDFMRTYYRVMAQHPHFPRLVFKLANLDESNPDNHELISVLDKVISPKSIKMFDKLASKGLLRANVDPKSALLSFFSMTVFPFLIPDKMLEKMNIKITPEFLDSLAIQNANLLNQGLFAQEESNNEES